MNLAEQVRQVHELKKAYEEANYKLKSQHDDYIDGNIESEFKYVVAKAKSSQVYFVNINDDYCVDHLDHVDWRCFKNLIAVEKIAQHHGFITEMVELEFEVPLKDLERDGYYYGDSRKWFEDDGRSPTIKALKITWGE